MAQPDSSGKAAASYSGVANSPNTLETDATLESKLDKLLNEFFTPEKPGVVALVAKDSKVVYQKAFGKANLELDVASATVSFETKPTMGLGGWRTTCGTICPKSNRRPTN